ncbi:MAG: MATE family efflux transporter [Clostridiales bacterium]|nr:MATE family efflux transporter [Clostridiales bacterium]
MANVLSMLFSTQYMVRNELKRGDMIPSREAYNSLLTIALPAIVEMVSISVIGMADTAMVGRLGPYAVAAVGLTNQPRMLFMSVFLALNVAVTAIVSRRKGQGEQESARQCLKQAIMAELGLVVLLSALQVVSAEWVMKLAGANEDTLSASVDYFVIMGFGLIFPAMSTTICAAQRGVGRTKITMTVNLAANVVNVIFNYLLIGGNFGFPRLGVAGAAIATVIGNGVGLVLAIMSLRHKHEYLHIPLKGSWKLDILMIKNIFSVTSGAMIEQLASRIGFFWFAAVVAGLGTNDFAAHQICMQLMNLSFTFADGVAAATTAMVGQNMGKNRPDLSIMFGKVGQRVAFIISIVLCISVISTRFLFASMFTQDQAIIALTADVLLILAFILPIQTSQIVMGGSLRGAGDTRFVALTMLATVTLIRPVLSSVLIGVFHFGLVGAWYAIVFDQIVRLTLLFTRFSRGKWIDIRV